MLAANAPWSELRPTVDEFLVFFDADMDPHFREEDDIVVPAAQPHAVLQEVAARTLAEHHELRADIARLRAARESEAECRDVLARLEPVITAHVHMEEQQLFEGVQAALSESELGELGRRSAAFRRIHRAPDASGPRPGRG